MVPVNWTNNTLERSSLTYSDIDKLSISNIPTGSRRYAELSIFQALSLSFILLLLKELFDIVYNFYKYLT